MTKMIKLIVNVTLINRHRIPSPMVTVLGSAILSLRINSLPVKSTSHGRKGHHDHCKNIKSILSGLKVTCNTKCSKTSHMSRCLSKQHVHQIGVSANNTDSTSYEMVGLQDVDCLNCTKTVLFPLKNKKRMPVNARSLPEFSVHPSDDAFSYLKKKKYFLISNTTELGSLHLLTLCAYNTSYFSLKKMHFHIGPLEQKNIQ